jgi:phospholipase/lecithinase/hemolysin
MRFNLALKDALDVFESSYAGNLFRADVFSFMADVASNFENSTEAKLNSDGSQNDGSYLFWDSLHPTTEAHELLAEYSAASVPIPGAVWLFGSGIVCLVSFKRRKNGRIR